MEQTLTHGVERIHVGNYEFDANQMLGQGAYGSVFKGHRIFDGGPVALKRVPSGLMKDVEVDGPAKSRSPYIVDCLDVINVPAEDATYMVMELCDTDLRNFLLNYGSLTAENLDLLAKCLAEGYATLRLNGIIHRDIKPENIMLKLDQSSVPPKNARAGQIDRSAQPRINVAKFGDFGCSRSEDDALAGETRNLAGTLHYMAPEVGANIVEWHAYDSKVDMWSMGVVLYECASGKLPFDERQICKLFLKATEGNYCFDAPVPEECVEKYQIIIRALLSLNPARRLSASDFRDCVFEHTNNPVVKKLLNKGLNNSSKNGKTSPKNATKFDSCSLFAKLFASKPK